MTKVANRTEIDLIVVIGECHVDIEIEVEVGTLRSMDKIIEVDCKTITEMTLGEEIIGRCKITDVSRTIEVDVGTVTETIMETCIDTNTETITQIITETTIEMAPILEEVEVGLEKDNPQVLSEGMTEAVVDQNQDQGLVQEPVQTEIGLDVTNVENMIILMKIVLPQTWTKNQSK